MKTQFKRKMPTAHSRNKALSKQQANVIARQQTAHVKELYQKYIEVARCRWEQWRYCNEHPYDNAAFAEYERLRQASKICEKAYQAYAPERYAASQARDAECEIVHTTTLHQSILQLGLGDVRALELPLRFLEADAWVFGSGYTKERIIRYINRLPLSDEDAQRLRRVVLMVIDRADGRREFRSYCRLARKVDSPELRAELEKRQGDPNRWVRYRAKWALEACRKPQ